VKNWLRSSGVIGQRFISIGKMTQKAEIVWFPFLALSPYITWQQIDDNSAKAAMISTWKFDSAD
jgi:hypothetical protein